MKRSTAILATAATLLATTAMAQVTVDPTLPTYEASSGVSGALTSIGSDTLNNQMTLWAEGFRSFYPNVQVEVQGAGSGTAPPALVQGTAQFGPMSRAMRGTEIEEFEARFGYPPTPMRGAIDALAVYVHKDNPLECMTMQQVDAVFSSTRNGGADAPINTWGDLGMTGDWASRPIALYGRNSASGTYGYFKQVALFDGDFRPEVREQPGSSTVVQGVGSDLYAIGYSGVGYMTADVRAVPLSTDGDCYEATGENAAAGYYPLARFLYVYMNKNPNEAMEPLRAEFVKYVYSQQGQADVLRAGFFPIVKAVADADLAVFGIAE
ncbi:MAG: PstS family phosphate ABC transporter substrate-binding protein [Paracoccaceae bacterium]